mmetsp:Transcript_19902/g.42452  ORF Transcript_19902/g.42452 Transcript_19902/m.42452 type:complete len:630 (-) Transcript_19902:42-1931(-)
MRKKGEKKAPGPAASGGKKEKKPKGKEAVKAVIEEEDWLGKDGGDEAIPGGEPDSDEELLGEDEEEELGDGGDDDEEMGQIEEGGGDDDNDGSRATLGSKLLAKVASGEQMDLATIKQHISDDATLLSSWRKAKQLGDKRTREEVFTRLTGNCSTYYGYSEELAEYFLQMFSPEKAVEFFEANEQHRPLTIRTNSLKTRRAQLIQSLTARKAHVEPVGAWTKVGLKVYDSAVPIGATPEYLGGHYMIQSASSFVPVMALAPQQNEVVLDMAAAPGGKTTYIGQLMRNTGTLFANDLRKERCKSLVANVHRLGLTNVVVTNMDGKKLQGMLPKLDRVLLDAPCSGSGIIARDPSVKVKRGMKDFEEISRLQKELLTTAIDMVNASSKTGGYIVYSTCSVSVEENEAVIEHALRVRNVELVSFSSAVNFGVEGLTKYRERRFNPAMNNCRRFLPHVHNMDGFFVAKLKKTSNDVPERAKKDRSKGGDHIKVWGEEHWTPEMMETVVDFTPAEDKEGAAATSAPKNKRERKKLKRSHLQQQYAEKMAAKEPVAKEPEEEPKPRKAKKLKKQGATTTAGAAAAVAPSKDEVAAKLPKKKKRRAEVEAEAKKPAATSQEELPARPKKKRRKPAE